MRVRVDLHRYPARGRLLEHGIEIDAVRLAREQEPPRGMPDDSEIGVVHRGQQARGHFPGVEIEPGVDRRDHKVELTEHGLVVVDPTVGQDVGLDALEHPEAGQARVHRVDLVRLTGQIVRLEPAGIGGRLAVVGETDVRVAGCLAGERQLLDRVGAVGV